MAKTGRNEVIKTTKTYEADGALVQYTFVKLDSNGEVTNTGDGEEIKGVTLDTAAAQGDRVEVALQNAGNIVRVVSGAATTTGNKVASDAAGKAINAATADIEVGQNDDGAAALDEFTIVHLTRGLDSAP